MACKKGLIVFAPGKKMLRSIRYVLIGQSISDPNWVVLVCLRADISLAVHLQGCGMGRFRASTWYLMAGFRHRIPQS
jgi:hypothetical protein